MTHDAPPMELVAVGVVHAPYETADEAPHQGFAADTESTIEIYEEYTPGLTGLDAIDGSPVVDLKPALRPER